ncbi:MAG: fibronectin type III domain-containing protein [Nitrospirae bacterium]|nr:fibronectin type III domain-containing protein [Nitrospirota bacterium]
MLTSCGKKGEPTLVTFVKPAPVTNISVVHREDALLLSWSYSVSSDMQDLIKGFYVEKAVGNSDKIPTEFKNIVFLPANVTHYTDNDFTAGTAYFYRILVLSVRNIISDQSPVIKVTPLMLPPAPAGLSYEVKNDAVDIRWKAAEGKIKYNIYKGRDKNVSSAVLLNKSALSGPLFSDKVETYLPSYYFVRSLLDSDIKDEGFPSEVLEVNPADFVPSKPSALKYVYARQGGLVLLWNENPETWVKRYHVYRKRATESNFGFIGEAVTPTFKDNSPLNSQTTYYVTALGTSREGGASALLEVNPPPQDR